jgi:putative endonuclease
MMASASGVLSIGVTNDLERRVFEHKNKMVPGFSARYNVRKLVYFELFSDVRAAIAREKELLKGWLRRRKVALIESVNPHWNNLSPAFHSERSEESLRPLRSSNPHLELRGMGKT